MLARYYTYTTPELEPLITPGLEALIKRLKKITRAYHWYYQAITKTNVICS